MTFINIVLPLACFVAIILIMSIWTWRQVRKPLPPAPRVVDQAVVERMFPVQHDIASGECTVCIEELEAGQACRRLQCGHAFHAGCIDGWFLRGSRAMVCPSCRHQQEEPSEVTV